MAEISEVINVSLLESGAAAARDNMNVCAIFTSDTSVLNSNNRYALYKNVASVASDFGTNSAMNEHAKIFFSQSPNPINASGVLVAAYWRSAEEAVAASAGVLTGAQLSEAVVVAALQSVSDGAFDIDIDGATQNITSVDFQTISELSDVITLINAEISGATAALSDLNQIVITSATTGASSEVSLISDPGPGTFIGETLGLSSGTGAVSVDGLASSTLALETKEDAVTAVKALVNFKGFVFIDDTTDDESEDLAAWAQSNGVLGYDVFNGDAHLEKATSNPVWANTLAGYTNYRALYRSDNDRKFATGYMSRNHVVNFSAENSAITMHLKDITGIVPEDLTQTVIDKAKAVGLDIYVSIKDIPVVLTSPANDFVDNRYNLLAFVDAIETDLFNFLSLSATKIPQTTRGVNQLVDQAEKTTRGFVRAGVFAPGTWTSSDFFGSLETFNRNIEQNGFYWLAGKLSDQSVADRTARKSPVLQGAVKNAGAINSVDVIINFNI